MCRMRWGFLLYLWSLDLFERGAFGLRPVMSAVELILAVFGSQAQAVEALDDLRAGEENGALRLVNAAVLTKSAEGKPTVLDEQDLSPARGSLFGALVGGLVGLLGGPVGTVIGAVAGAATGGLAAAKMDLGFDDEFLNEVKAALKPGTSALLLLVEAGGGDRVSKALQEMGAELLRHAVSQEVLDKLAS